MEYEFTLNLPMKRIAPTQFCLPVNLHFIKIRDFSLSVCLLSGKSGNNCDKDGECGPQPHNAKNPPPFLSLQGISRSWDWNV